MGATPREPDANDLAEFDGAAEVDAVASTQRRIALGYGAVFLLVTFAGPVLTVGLPWWTEARLPGGLSPSFLTAAVGFYVLLVAVAVAATTLANATEDRMLGTSNGLDGDLEVDLPPDVPPPAAPDRDGTAPGGVDDRR